VIDFIFEWFNWAIIALISGVINLIVAFKQLGEECKFLVFFEPHKTFGVWLWSLAQLLLPSYIFWLTASLSSKPTITSTLVFQSLAFGVGFVALVNAKTETGFLNLDIKTVYSQLVRIAFGLIASKETARTTAFRTDLEKHMNTIEDLSEGIEFLTNYFTLDVSLSSEQKEQRRSKLSEIKAREKSEQVKLISALMDVRRTDLPQVLHRFGCASEFIIIYFPRSNSKSLLIYKSNKP